MYYRLFRIRNSTFSFFRLGSQFLFCINFIFLITLDLSTRAITAKVTWKQGIIVLNVKTSICAFSATTKRVIRIKWKSWDSISTMGLQSKAKKQIHKKQENCRYRDVFIHLFMLVSVAMPTVVCQAVKR